MRLPNTKIPASLARRLKECEAKTGIDSESITRMALHVYLEREGFI